MSGHPSPNSANSSTAVAEREPQSAAATGPNLPPAALPVARRSPAADALRSREAQIGVLAIAAILIHVVLRYGLTADGGLWNIAWRDIPLLLALIIGGVPLVLGLASRAVRGEFSSDLLAGISIVTGVLLHEYLAATLVVLMLSGGQALENFAVRSASSVLDALARRMPTRTHRRADGMVRDVPLEDVAIGDLLVVFPHEICPVDGIVIEGHGAMDESYLTGEPYVMSKVPGSAVLSGAINAHAALTIRAEKLPRDSRYAKIMEVMRESERRRPRIRRLGDQLGAVYTPIAVAIAVLAWLISGEVTRFLAVLVVATPCPLLIAIPVAIIGSISLAARRGIIIKDPVVLEKISGCRTAMFDKTGTLTYGKPRVTDVVAAPGFDRAQVLALAAGLEQYSRHPLAAAVIEAARAAGLAPHEAGEVSERPGAGLRGRLNGRDVRITSRQKFATENPGAAGGIPGGAAGMECVVVIDGQLAATIRFRDEPRSDGKPFIRHLSGRHGFQRVLLVSGDRESEVRYLAEQVGIADVYADQSPEMKLALVRSETSRADTVFVGDGINDAPALTAATVGIAFGQNGDVTSEAAGAVILDSSIRRVDELLHISRRMRAIAMQSAVGGMIASVVGMLIAAAGFLPPVAGALLQEIIDVVAVVNALRVAAPPRMLTDY